MEQECASSVQSNTLARLRQAYRLWASRSRAGSTAIAVVSARLHIGRAKQGVSSSRAAVVDRI